MISSIFHTLCCPDDGADVIQRGDYLECLKCHREFSILADNLVEMLPSNFPIGIWIEMKTGRLKSPNLKWFRMNRNICEYKISQVKQLLSEAGIEDVQHRNQTSN